jgi:acyl-coenzyme A thioesterase PaaI-like protein
MMADDRATTTLSPEQIGALLDGLLPEPLRLEFDRMTEDGLSFRARPETLRSRSGGTVSGPTQFALLDAAAYVSVNALLGGRPGAMLVTSSMSFLEAVAPTTLVARVRPLRMGLRLAVLAAALSTEDGLLVAEATLHFALPSRRRSAG